MPANTKTSVGGSISNYGFARDLRRIVVVAVVVRAKMGMVHGDIGLLLLVLLIAGSMGSCDGNV